MQAQEGWELEIMVLLRVGHWISWFFSGLGMVGHWSSWFFSGLGIGDHGSPQGWAGLGIGDHGSSQGWALEIMVRLNVGQVARRRPSRLPLDAAYPDRATCLDWIMFVQTWLM